MYILNFAPDSVLQDLTRWISLSLYGSQPMEIQTPTPAGHWAQCAE
jgi:hypothetical protein